ncbi:hypothetical protein Rai3103_00590 [Raineyella fluvialis]|uniref:Uncharacterized protein n=1 Tax=Raineyella fluvialis TaxID=2662261 RepID=A0A5Q2F6Y2_9ACTN|nr:hypothetical protein Rai3103_00590 [Raineyella fluvialis]
MAFSDKTELDAVRPSFFFLKKLGLTAPDALS